LPLGAPQTVLESTFVASPAGWAIAAPFTAWADGAYRLTPRQPGRFVAVAAPLPASIADVSVQATFQKVGGPPGGGYGIVLRDQQAAQRDGLNQNGQFYVLAVGDLGEVGVWLRNNDEWLELLPWTPSDAVRRGPVRNDLAVRSVGQHLAFAVNGTPVFAREDAHLGPGGIGVFAGGDANDVALHRFVAQAPT